MTLQVCHQMVQIQCRLWNNDLVVSLTDRMIFHFHLTSSLVVLSRDFISVRLNPLQHGVAFLYALKAPENL